MSYTFTNLRLLNNVRKYLKITCISNSEKFKKYFSRRFISENLRKLINESILEQDIFQLFDFIQTHAHLK